MSIITQRGNLSEIVAEQLSKRIDSGMYSPGERLPSSAQLCAEFGVSRTVVREALASLKVGGRVNARQGAGVFVSEHETRPLSFEIDPVDDVRSAMQILELRLGVELQSVALAAQRRTPEALADIARAYGTHSTRRARRFLSYFEEQGLVVVHTDFSGKRIVAFPDLEAQTAPGDPNAPLSQQGVAAE